MPRVVFGAESSSAMAAVVLISWLTVHRIITARTARVLRWTDSQTHSRSMASSAGVLEIVFMLRPLS